VYVLNDVFMVYIYSHCILFCKQVGRYCFTSHITGVRAGGLYMFRNYMLCSYLGARFCTLHWDERIIIVKQFCFLSKINFMISWIACYWRLGTSSQN